MRALLLGLLLMGCDDDTLKGVGEPCNSSGECAAGLLCDFGMRPTHTCQPEDSVTRRDMTFVPEMDMSGDDQGVADMSQVD
jgi:hypothetical protein